MKNFEHLLEVQQYDVFDSDNLISFYIKSVFTNVWITETLKMIKQLPSTELREDHAIKKTDYKIKNMFQKRKEKKKTINKNQQHMHSFPFATGITHRFKETLERKNITARFNTVKKIRRLLPPN